MSTPRSGAGDPARSLALLWRTSEPLSRSRGGPPLTVDRIVAAAIGLADAHDLPALTMRRVAERLAVAPMSIYTHVPGKAELLDLMLDQVYAEVALPPVGSPGRWRQGLEHVARENHALYLRHPWLLRVATGRPVLGPGLIAKYDGELAAVDGLGLSDVDMDAVLALVLSFVHGAAREAVEASRARDQTGLTDEQWWAANAPYLERVLDPARYPLAARVGTAAGQEHGAASDPVHAFEFGLARVLDGVAAYVGR